MPLGCPLADALCTRSAHAPRVAAISRATPHACVLARAWCRRASIGFRSGWCMRLRRQCGA
eukprot:1577027-Prymnesium_polylepis.1